MGIKRLYSGQVEDPVWKVLIPESVINKRLMVLAQQLQEFIESSKQPVVMAIVGNGGFWLGHKLIDILPPLGYRWSIVIASSYGDSETGSSPMMTLDGLGHLEGCNVILVDDIFDTGRTTSSLRAYLIHYKKALTVKICVLLEKPVRKDPQVTIAPDYVGLVIPDTFVAGCGLDGGKNFQYTRNFPEIRYKGEAPAKPWFTFPQ